MDASELLKRYAAGERNFFGVELFDCHKKFIGDEEPAIQLNEPNLHQRPVNLEGSSLVYINLFRANFKGANLKNADLSHANLSGINLSYADLSNATLFDIQQIEDEFDTFAPMESEKEFINLSYAKLSNADLTNADLTGADLTGADLTGADLTLADLTNAKLTNSNLSQVNLSGLDLSYMDLSSAILLGADLTNTNLTSTNFTGADLTGADLSGAKINGTIFGRQNASEELQQKNQALEALEQKNQELAEQVTLLKAQLEKQKMTQDLKQPSNQGINSPYQWNGFYFRSKAEIKIAEALDRAGVLFYPNNKARLNKAQSRINKESDFLVFQSGKFGILEVDGRPYHQTAADDHERDRLFKRYGIRVIERFDATRCWNEPDKVVREFLEILNHV